MNSHPFHLLLELVKKELRLRYKRSVLGVAWSLLNPLLMMAIFTLIFSRFPRLAGDGIPYYAFFLTGYLAWTFFATTCANGKDAIVANSGIVKQAAFERWTLPAATVLANLVHFTLALGLWLGYLGLFSGIELSDRLVLLPLLIFMQTMLIYGIVAFLSALHVVYRDIGQILELLLTFLFYLTPVFYSFSLFEPTDRWLLLGLKLNPMAHFVMLYRAVLFPEFSFSLGSLAYCMIWSICIPAAGSRYFSARSRVFAKEL